MSYQEISSLTNFDVQTLKLQFRKIIFKVYKNSIVKEMSEELKNYLAYNFINQGLWISNDHKEWLKLLLYKDFILFDNYLIAKVILNDIINRICLEPFSINNNHFKYLYKSQLFRDKYLKRNMIFNNEIYFHTKKIFINWYLEKYRIINSVKDFSNLKQIMRTQNTRNLSGILERYSFICKVGKDSFIKFTSLMKIELLKLYPLIKDIIEKRKIYKFREILTFLKRTESYKEDIFPGDALYYAIRKEYKHKFSFDSGNRMVIFPRHYEFEELSVLLEKKFPKGYGLIDLKFIQSIGYSETIRINTNLIWQNIYLSKEAQSKIYEDFSNYFSKGKFLNYPLRIAEVSSEPTRFYLKHNSPYTRISRWFNNISLFFKVFVNWNAQADDIQAEKKEFFLLIIDFIILRLEETVKHFMAIVNNRSSIKMKKNILAKKAIDFLRKNNLLIEFLVFFYKNNQKMPPENKLLIKEYLEKNSNLKK